jgi:hypothetical protein
MKKQQNVDVEENLGLDEEVQDNEEDWITEGRRVQKCILVWMYIAKKDVYMLYLFV